MTAPELAWAVKVETPKGWEWLSRIDSTVVYRSEWQNRFTFVTRDNALAWRQHCRRVFRNVRVVRVRVVPKPKPDMVSAAAAAAACRTARDVALAEAERVCREHQHDRLVGQASVGAALCADAIAALRGAK